MDVCEEELGVVRSTVALDDARLRRSLTSPLANDAGQQITRAADDLRSDVAPLNELRIAQEAQIQGLEASNRRLQEHVRVPRHRARPSIAAQLRAVLCEWVSARDNRPPPPPPPPTPSAERRKAGPRRAAGLQLPP
jgi:hypothetical protein